MPNLIKYGSYSEEAAASEQEELDRSGSNYLKLGEGRHQLRVLPPPVGRNSPFVLTHQHYIQLPNLPSAVSFVCPRLMAKKACPACTKVDELRRTGNPVDFQTAGDYLPKLRIYAVVIDRAAPEKGPQVWAFGKTIHGPLTNLRAEGDFTDPEDGFDVIVVRKGTGKNDTEYTVTPSRQNSPLAESVEQMNEWLSTMPDIGLLAQVRSPEDLNQVLAPDPAAAPTGHPNVSGSGRSSTRGSTSTGTPGGRRPSRTAADDAEEEES